MSEDSAPSVDQTALIKPVSHGRILGLMAVLGVAAGIAGFAIWSFKFGLGILIGTALAFANYYWLKSSLRKMFAAAESGEPPRMLAVKYFLRYLILAGVVAVFYVTDLIPVVAVIIGLGMFGFAVVIEGLFRIFSRP